ncbi:MAG: hypothetical protein ABI391_06465 [Hyphomicrobiaceae bacterium]
MSTAGPRDIQQVIARLEGCDRTAVQWKRVDDGPVERLDVQPAENTLCRFSIEVQAKGGRDYGFYFGHGAAFESLIHAEFDLHSVAGAVIEGMVRETVWMFGKSFVVRNEVIVTLPDARTLGDTCSILVPWLWKLAAAHDIEYRPYPMAR